MDNNNYKDIFDWIWNFVNSYTLIWILIWWFFRIFYVFLSKTTVLILATKIDKPDDIDIKKSLWILNKENDRIKIIKNLDEENWFDLFERVKNYYNNIISKIDDLKEKKHISIFLLAHQSFISKIWYDFQDQKNIKLYHKLRDTYWNSWSWEKWYHFRLIKYYKNWKEYIKDWKYIVKKSDDFDWNKDIILKIQISFKINSTIEGIELNNIFELNLEKDNIIWNKSFLRRYYQINDFEKEFKKHLKEIEDKIWRWKIIHILMNVPAPFAFIIWRNIHISNSSKIKLYEEKWWFYKETFNI